MASTFGVHPSMAQLLSWLLSPTLRLWLRAWWGRRWFPPLTQVPLWSLSPLLHPDQIGGVWRTLMCLSISTRSPLPSMRLCPNTSPLLPPLAPVPWSSPLPSPMLATSSTAFHLLHWVSTCRTRSSAAASAIGWEFPFTALLTPAQSPTVLLMFLEIIKLAVGVMVIGSSGTITSMMSSFVLPCLHQKRCPISSWTLSPDLQTSFYQHGIVAALQH